MPAPLARALGVQIVHSPPEAEAKVTAGVTGSRHVRAIFAAKTAAAAIIALLIAFTFDLDQPQWALITVFIVAQPQSGLVLAKSFHRIIGTLVGAAMALLLVGLFAQERVVFLGALAMWVGVCTFASQHARNFAAYGFVLSGYAAAIVGIPGALAADHAFFIAVARVTEVCLGIVVTVTISHLILPLSLAASVRQAIVVSRSVLADHAAALLGGGASTPTKLLGEARATRDLFSSAVFEDAEMRQLGDALRRLHLIFARVITIGQLLRWQLDATNRKNAEIEDALAEAAIGIRDWRHAVIDTSQLRGRLVRAGVALCAVGSLDDDEPDAELAHHIAVIARLREFLASFIAFARAYEVFALGRARPSRTVGPRGTQDWIGAASAGARAALAVILVGSFWILADWPRGSTAVILSTVVTARLATMEGGAKAGLAGAVITALATLPAFIIVEVLLAHSEGFAMFTLIVAPVLFLCAYLMGSTKPPLTYLAGFLFALDFASVGGFQDRMTYDGAAFINTSIAVTLAIAVGGVLFGVVAPETPERARRRFERGVQHVWRRIADPRHRQAIGAFEAASVEALEQFQPKDPDDIACWEAGVALLAAGGGLIRLPTVARASSGRGALNNALAALASRPDTENLERVRQQLQSATAEALADLHERPTSPATRRGATRSIAALSAIIGGLGRGGALVLCDHTGRTSRDAA